MAKVTVTIEGDECEVARVLRRLMRRGHGGHGGGCGGGHRRQGEWSGKIPEATDERLEGGPESRRTQPPEGVGHRRHGRGGRRGWWGEMEGFTPWTAEELQSLWREVTAGARTVLAEIAKRPEGYSNIDLQQALGMPGNAIGGTLSSVGVVSRKFGMKPPVYVFRWEAYRMFPWVAEVISRLAQEPPAGAEAPAEPTGE